MQRVEISKMSDSKKSTMFVQATIDVASKSATIEMLRPLAIRPLVLFRTQHPLFILLDALHTGSRSGGPFLHRRGFIAPK